jgi:hypothetical protein
MAAEYRLTRMECDHPHNRSPSSPSQAIWTLVSSVFTNTHNQTKIFHLTSKKINDHTDLLYDFSFGSICAQVIMNNSKRFLQLKMTEFVVIMFFISEKFSKRETTIDWYFINNLILYITWFYIYLYVEWNIGYISRKRACHKNDGNRPSTKPHRQLLNDQGASKVQEKRGQLLIQTVERILEKEVPNKSPIYRSSI